MNTQIIKDNITVDMDAFYNELLKNCQDTANHIFSTFNIENVICIVDLCYNPRFGENLPENDVFHFCTKTKFLIDTIFMDHSNNTSFSLGYFPIYNESVSYKYNIENNNKEYTNQITDILTKQNIITSNK